MLKFLKNNIHALAIALISGLGLLFIGFILFLWLISIGIFGPVPNHEELSSIHQQQSSRIISADDVQIGTFHLQNRTVISLEDVSPAMTDALLAIEDIRFHRHNGIDYRALGRVFVRTILLRQNAGGGSTITQQLAKNLYPRENSSGLFLTANKLREMMIAKRLERIYSKDEILELYLNTVPFGENTYGIEMASKRFFNKPPSELTVSESATLAGLLRATTYYNPNRNPERSLARRNVVIRQMERYNMINDSLAAEYIEQPLGLDYNRESASTGMAAYFTEHLRKELQKVLNNEPSLDGKSYNLMTDGLNIHTTIDSRVQEAAVKAVNTHMMQLQEILDHELENNPVFGLDDPDILRVWEQSDDYKELVSEGTPEEEIEEILHTPVQTQVFSWDGYHQKEISPYEEIKHYLSFLNAGFLAINPEKGHITAWVGGIDYRHFQYDQVIARRQPGSAFKPILYAAALENGRQPCDYQRNLYATYADYDDWTPRNVDDEYGGRYSLQAALAQSVNTVAVHVARETGPSNIRQTAAAMGIQTPLANAPSIALGTAEVSLLELTTAYSTFLNEGKPVVPEIVTHITNSDGEIIYDFTGIMNDDNDNEPDEDENIEGAEPGISKDTAAAMVSMLQKAVNEGTGRPLRDHFGIQYALGGKTGTTQNYSDGWFIGITPDLVFGTRIGGFNQRVRFREYPAYASQTALPLAGHFLNNLSMDESSNIKHASFYDHQLDTEFDLQCTDTKNERVRDRLRDFFSGRDSDEPQVISDEEEEKKGNIFQRIGRRLGISGDDDPDDDGNNN